jgi:NADH dehydrogenase (ubiquinone) 1 alpha subcomplex subunit 8
MAAQYQKVPIANVEFRDPTAMPDDVPKVDEVGASSAPLKSAAFFIGAFCREYNEDFMLCKNENNDPEHCLKEGRKVTRCTIDL